MTVDRIEPLDKRRCKVFVDGDLAFALYKGEICFYHIEEGAELSERDYREILEVVLCKRARERALYLLKFSNKTEAELRQKLKSGFYPEEAVNKAIQFLKEYHYLDDARYARNYVEVYGGQKSRAEIKGALLKKGIERTCIAELFEECQPDEEQQIRRLLEKRRYKEDAPTAEKRKTMAFLMRKGFSYDTIKRVVKESNEEDLYCE